MNAEPGRDLKHRAIETPPATSATTPEPDASVGPVGAADADVSGPIADRALVIRGDDDKGLSLSERLINSVYRLTWRTPLHKLRLKASAPLRLLMVPADPIAGNAARGTAIRAGHFRYLGLQQPVRDYDFDTMKLPPGFQDYLHGFGWLRDLAAAAPRDKVRELAERLVQQWLSRHGENFKPPAWRPDVAAWRLINCAAYAPLIIGGRDRAHRKRVLTQLAVTARHLDRTANKADPGIGRLTAWAGVVAASLLLPDGHPRRVYGEAGLRRAMLGTFGADGGVFSRAPMEQFQAIAVLSVLRSLYDQSEEADLPDAVHDALDMAVAAFQGVTHDDGSLAGWQGAPALDAATVGHLIDRSGIIARPLRQARYWGYQRIPAGRTVVLVDAGPPPIARHAATGCASTLAFEMSSNGQRIITSCGGASAVGAVISARLSQGLRATAAHSTLCLDNLNSTAILPKGRLGKGVGEVELERREVDEATRLEMSHDGYSHRHGLIHRRILLLRSDGSELRGEDLLLPSAQSAKARKTRFTSLPFAIRFHLGEHVEAHGTGDGQAVLLRLEDGQLWQLRATNAKLAVEDSLWVDGHNRPRPTKQVVISDEIGPGGGNCGWILRKMG
ncbi:MAG: heparinase II/III family protein [Pseudomonadota bacterium]